MCRSRLSRYDGERGFVRAKISIFFSHDKSLVLAAVTAVNSRVSDSFEWIRVNVCVMSEDPPDYLCAPSSTSYVPGVLKPQATSHNHWTEAAWKLTTVFVGIVCAALILQRRRELRSNIISNRKQLFMDSPGSSVDELEGLNGGASGPHLKRYESLQGVEVTTVGAGAQVVTTVDV